MLFLHGMAFLVPTVCVAELPFWPTLYADIFIMWGIQVWRLRNGVKWGSRQQRGLDGSSQALGNNSNLRLLRKSLQLHVLGEEEAKRNSGRILWGWLPIPLSFLWLHLHPGLCCRGPGVAERGLGWREHGEVLIRSQEIRDCLNPVPRTGKPKMIL